MVPDGALYGSGIDGLAVFDEARAFMQHVPDDPAESVGDGLYGFDISQPDDQPTEQGLQVAPFLVHAGLRGLAEQAAHEAIPFGAAARMVFGRALVRPWTHAKSRKPAGARTGRPRL